MKQGPAQVHLWNLVGKLPHASYLKHLRILRFTLHLNAEASFANCVSGLCDIRSGIECGLALHGQSVPILVSSMTYDDEICLSLPCETNARKDDACTCKAS